MPLLLLLVLVPTVTSYNLDPHTATVYTSPGGGRGDYFGYSVTFTHDKQLMVGAPRSNSSLSAPEPGALYSCNPANPNSCVRVNVDPDDTGALTEGHVNRRNFGWLGGTSLLVGDSIVTCSPRWAQTYEEDAFMNGACYWRTQASNQRWQKLLPLSEIKDQRKELPGTGRVVYHYQYGQYGLSAALLPDSGSVVFGAPGVSNWAGTLVRGTMRSLAGGLSTMVTSVMDPLDAGVYDHYLGYSVTAGRYYGNNELVAAAAPRASDVGKVYILQLSASTARMDALAVLEGPSAYAGYGHSLASGDFDNDGYDELVVGAPLASSDGLTEDGEVAVYGRSSKVGLPLVKRLGIKPITSGGRFGSALSTVGDLDFDGFVDLAVGAPYEDEGRGAVYIYSGGPGGIGPTPSQRVAAADVHSALRGFGGAVVGGVDTDGNGYNDLAVGSSDSGHVVLLQSRSVVYVNTSLQVRPPALTLDAQVFTVRLCALYTGHLALGDVDMAATVKLDSRVAPPTSRAYFQDSGQSEASVNLRVPAQQEDCAILTAQLKAAIPDVSLPFSVSVSVSSNAFVPDASSQDCPRCPVLAPHSSTSRSRDVPLAPGCGADQACHPQVALRASFPRGEEYVLGSSETVELLVEVAVEQEAAYTTSILVDLPESVTVKSVPVECRVEAPVGGASASQSEHVSCTMQSPIRAGQTVRVRIQTQVSTVSTAVSALVYNVSMSALNADASATAVLTLRRDVRISVHGIAEPERVVYGGTNMSALRPLAYIIQVQNAGVTTGAAVRLQVLLPAGVGSRDILQDTRVQTSLSGDCMVDQENRGTQDGGAAEKQDGGSEQDGGADEVQDGASVQDNGSEVVLSCADTEKTRCISVTCTFLQLEFDTVTVSSLLDSSALQEVYGSGAVVTHQATASAHWTHDTSVGATDAFAAVVAPVGWSPSETLTPWWVLTLAALGGVLLLGAITYLLYRCGFFNRKRPPVGEDADDADDASPDPGEPTAEEFSEFDALTCPLPMGNPPDDDPAETHPL